MSFLLRMRRSWSFLMDRSIGGGALLLARLTLMEVLSLAASVHLRDICGFVEVYFHLAINLCVAFARDCDLKAGSGGLEAALTQGKQWKT